MLTMSIYLRLRDKFQRCVCGTIRDCLSWFMRDSRMRGTILVAPLLTFLDILDVLDVLDVLDILDIRERGATSEILRISC